MRASVPLVLLACLALAAGAGAQGGSCGAGIEPPRLVSHLRRLSPGSAIVVDPGTQDLPDDVRLVGAGETPHRLRPIELARRLIALTLPADLAPGEYELRGLPGPSHGPYTVDAIALPAPPAAPRATLRRSERHDAGGLGEGTYEITLDAIVRGDVPTGAIALVGRWRDGEREASSWGNTSGAPISLASLVPCGGHGELAERGTRVRLRWVDAHGQLGAESRPVRVR